MAYFPLLCLFLTVVWCQTRTIWEYQLGPIVTNPQGTTAPSQDRAAQQAGFALADPIPGPDTNWLGCYPGDSYCHSASQINTQPQVSQPGLKDCWLSFAFAYYQTYINVPEGTTVTQFSVQYPGNVVDDAARITMYNSMYPNGQTLSYTFYREGNTVDLSSYIVTGQNRLIITQEDSCCCGNTVYAIILLNGEPVYPTCAPPQQNPCFNSVWDLGQMDCVLTPISGPSCDDGRLCTTNDVCVNGVCAGELVTCPPDQCNFGACNEATGECGLFPFNGTAVACDDSDACTQNDQCAAGACVGTPVTCTALDQCHVAGVCADGECSNPNIADGTACNDGDACTQTDTCVAGVCVGTNPVVCYALDQCHAPGVCDPATGICNDPPKCDGKRCDDGNACTQLDTCKAGVCVGGRPVVCTVDNPCHEAGECNTTSGVCSYDHKCDGTTCDDGNVCTVNDTCLDGDCLPGAPLACEPLDQCHDAGVCDATTGECSNPNKADGSPCDDGNACTQTDICKAGVCVGTDPKSCSALSGCHVAGSCDAATGECSSPTKPNGASCNDGNACTKTDTCQAGVCTGANPVVCKASDQCHAVGTCDAATGKCSDPNQADGTTCNDHDSCTQTDTCSNGKCVGSGQVCCRTSIGRCGTCVDNCRGSHQSVLNLFRQWNTSSGRNAGADDVENGRGGNCPAGKVCCVPKNQGTCRNDNNSCRIPDDE